MKVGILTFHKPINYGAYLQAFSLSNRLAKSFPNLQVEIIDYISPKEKKAIFLNVLRDVKNTGVVGGIKSLKKNAAFKKSQNRLFLSKKRLCTNDLEKVYRYIEKEYNFLIIGSDAVFNWNQTGFPTPFIPNRKLNIPVLTYAASVHGLKYLEVDSNDIMQCKKAFEYFSFVGTRDSCSEQFVKYCNSSIVPVHCCDPTVFIDVKKLAVEAGDFRKRINSKYGISLNKKYIVIMSPSNSLIDEIKAYYSDEYTFVYVFEAPKGEKNFLFDLSPFEWAEVLGNASVVITRYFHGALLSLAHGVPIVVVDYSGYFGDYESKLKDLMEKRLQLSEFYFNKSYAENFSLKDHPEFRIMLDSMLNGNYRQRIDSAVEKEKKCFNAFFESFSKIAKQ